ncbi:aminotransferase class III-fold pyridoxal phosphate-dependent enzyme [Balneatrix alpica]|uniref:Aminotransferase class III-fold pyridoxal phosphate-dependent enzyme n=1 Tax=Balneatrix alpica TaxID=75684 RepID=A0ABV5Z8A9_9GAMM|nr:aminotransferase class III-fold pyridoxal phosphate-dependent enzyme [Balneatrix alpica]
MSHSVFMKTYNRLPLAISRGQGIWLYDNRGHAYLDAHGNQGATLLGHCHPMIVEAIQAQTEQLIFAPNAFYQSVQLQLAQQLTQAAQMERLFFTNSGVEANEAALRIIRQYAEQRSIAHPRILVMSNAFHGRTLGTLNASDLHFSGPLRDTFIRVPFNNLDAIEEAARQHPDIVAVISEAIQSEAGVQIADASYLQGLRRICDRHEWLLVLDEVQSFARSGSLFYYQQCGIQPDVVTGANGLASGLPIGLCLARGTAGDILQRGDHGSTFGGNPLACAAALCTLHLIEAENLLERSKTLAQYLATHLQNKLGQQEYVRQIRHQGLMLAIELEEPCEPLMLFAQAKGVLLNVVGREKNTVRLLPPLTLSDQDAELMVTSVTRLIRVFHADDPE